MLILTRRLNETVRIADDITITVVGIQAGQIRLGFSAPKHVVVDREEVAISKKREKPHRGV